MTEPHAPVAPTLEALLRHFRWTRHLAAALVGGTDDASDLMQAAWERVLRQPPRGLADPRAWLRRVTTNVARSQHRAETRRSSREAAATDTANPVASPEDLTARIEVHRGLVTLVMSLAEPYRQAVLMRYFDELSAVEIARRLKVPEGTVRWRLKTGLDELRARLAAEHGGEATTWHRALAPLLGVRSLRRTRPAALLGATAVSLVAVTVATLVFVRVSTSEPILAAGGSRGDEGLSPFSSETHASVAPPRLNVASLGNCQRRVSELRARVTALESELDDYREPAELFAREPPNPGASATLEALLRERLSQLAPTATCRGLVCRLQLLVPESVARDTWEDPFRSLLNARTTSLLVDPEAPDPTGDASSGKRRFSYVAVLRDVGGNVVPLTQAQEYARRPHGLPPLPPAEPPSSTAACQAEASALEQQIASVEAELRARRPLSVDFLKNEPNPALTQEVRREFERVFGEAFANWPTLVACRGDLCAFRRQQFFAPILGIMRGDPFFSARATGPVPTHKRTPLVAQETLEALLPMEPYGGRDADGAQNYIPYIHVFRVLPPHRIAAAAVLEPFLQELTEQRPEDSCHRAMRDDTRARILIPAHETSEAQGRESVRRLVVEAVEAENQETPFDRCVLANIRARAARVNLPAGADAGEVMFSTGMRKSRNYLYTGAFIVPSR